MSFNFPSSPTLGQSYTPVGGYQYVWDGTAWRVLEAPQLFATAQSRNRIVNGAMQISQETGGTDTAGNIFAADQWGLYASGAACVSGRFTDATTNEKYVRFYNSTAKASVAATEQAILYQYVEGLRVSDFMWGTANAKPVVLHFQFRASVAGTYGLTVASPGPTLRTYVKPLTVAASVWTTFVFAIPGPVDGSWPADNTIGLSIQIAAIAGSNLLAPVEGWNTGNWRGLVGMSNGFLNATTSFSLKNVGLYLDPDATGQAPRWQMPDEAEELRACQRYYHKIIAGSASQNFGAGYFPNATLGRSVIPITVPMRSTPALSHSAVADFQMVGVSAFAPSSITYSAITAETFSPDLIVAGATAGQGGVIRSVNANAAFHLNARM